MFGLGGGEGGGVAFKQVEWIESGYGGLRLQGEAYCCCLVRFSDKTSGHESDANAAKRSRCINAVNHAANIQFHVEMVDDHNACHLVFKF